MTTPQAFSFSIPPGPDIRLGRLSFWWKIPKKQSAEVYLDLLKKSRELLIYQPNPLL
jgi:hypothetical protein